MKSPARTAVIAILCVLNHGINAEIVTDGSLGPVQQLNGPDFQITPDLGDQRGNQLFHSFAQFNLDQGQSANFIAGNGVNRIIGRVTGGDISSINGSINSANAALWLINPAGWLFGEQAQINVNGAFHVSTASSLNFQDGTQFFSDPAIESRLTISDPIGVSFLEAPTATISLDQSLIELPENSQFSAIANEINLENASIKTAGGEILLAATASPGDWQLTDTGWQSLNSGRLGQIQIRNTDFPVGLFNETLSFSDRSGNHGGGRIQLLAGLTRLENALISGINFSETDAGVIDLFNTGTLEINGSQLITDTFSSASAGSIVVKAETIVLDNSSRISATAQPFTRGDAGQIEITALDTLKMTDRSEIFSLVAGQGQAADIRVSADQILMDNLATISTTTSDISNAGNIVINSQNLEMESGATIDSSALLLGPGLDDAGSAGQITINSSRISIADDLSFITTSSFGRGGVGGDILIQSEQLKLSNQAEIRAISESGSDAGNITVINQQSLAVNNAAITTRADSADGGRITIQSDDILLNNGLVTTSVNGLQGDGGNINLNSNVLLLDSGFVQANTSAINGQGGDILIQTDNLIATQQNVQIGGENRLQFQTDSSVNVIQAAAPDGVDGRIELSSTELDITGDIQNLNTRFVQLEKLENNPCRVKRGESRSSFILQGKGGQVKNASDLILLPVIDASDSENSSEIDVPLQLGQADSCF